MSGIICANYGNRMYPRLKPCKSAYHAHCFRQHANDKFPVLKAKDLDDCLLDEEEELDDIFRGKDKSVMDSEMGELSQCLLVGPQAMLKHVGHVQYPEVLQIVKNIMRFLSRHLS